MLKFLDHNFDFIIQCSPFACDATRRLKFLEVFPKICFCTSIPVYPPVTLQHSLYDKYTQKEIIGNYGLPHVKTILPIFDDKEEDFGMITWYHLTWQQFYDGFKDKFFSDGVGIKTDEITGLVCKPRFGGSADGVVIVKQLIGKLMKFQIEHFGNLKKNSCKKPSDIWKWENKVFKSYLIEPNIESSGKELCYYFKVNPTGQEGFTPLYNGSIAVDPVTGKVNVGNYFLREGDVPSSDVESFVSNNDVRKVFYRLMSDFYGIRTKYPVFHSGVVYRVDVFPNIKGKNSDGKTYYVNNKPKSNKFFISEFGLVPLNITFIDDASQHLGWTVRHGADPIQRLAKAYAEFLNEHHFKTVS